MAKTVKKKKKKHPPVHTTAFHGQSEDGFNVVGIGNLRVVLIQDDDAWFAQGLEIDYAAQGSSVEDVKKKFAQGLCATLHENLKAYGNIERILRVAPPQVWNELFYNPGSAIEGVFFGLVPRHFRKHETCLRRCSPDYAAVRLHPLC